MNQLPHLKDFNAPDGYFEQLPDQILDQVRPPKSISWIKYAAAAAVIASLGLAWQMGLLFPQQQTLTLEEEVSLHIDSQSWSDEDVLSLVDDPQAVLDEILTEELPAAEELWLEDEQNWF